MRATILLSVVVLFALALLSSTGVAQFPHTMNYQVMLTDDLDQPLVDQSVQLVFRMYELEFGGSPGWTETHNTTTNSIGVVSVILGSTNPLSFAEFPGLLWLEVEVDGEIMSPRRELTAAPYAFDSFGAHQLAGLPGDDYTTDAELSTPGTINQPSNPVDWTKLKNVPAGFADGEDEAGGAGDGHSLDADDGSPVDAVYVDEDGKVGIGLTNIQHTLHVHKASSSDPSIGLTNSSSGGTSSDGVMLKLTSGTGANLQNHENGNLTFWTGNPAARARLYSDGLFEVGSLQKTGALDILRAGISDPVVSCYSDTYGGHVEVYDEAGNLAGQFEVDNSGTGGHLQISRDDAYGTEKGIDLNGNWAASEEPALRIMGSARGAYFFMDYTGSSSVQLPADAINDAEILNEPGVASDVKTTSVGLGTGSYTTITSKSITVPASGYVLVMAGCTIRAVHGGGMSDADIGVSDSPSSLPSTQMMTFTIPSATAAGTYRFPGAYHTVFPVAAAGTYTYYFLGQEYSGAISIWDIQLSLAYFPTAYTSVDPPLPAREGAARHEEQEPGGGLSAAEIAAEQAEAQAFHLARIERELAEIKAEVDAMKEEG